MAKLRIILTLLVLAFSMPAFAQSSADVVIIGGGASGTMAAIQAARMDVEVLVVEETPWLGGMLTSAGVSAIDGNHELPSGLWGEFRQKLYDHYGGPKAVATGWVSHCLFEPAVGAAKLAELASGYPNLNVIHKASLKSLSYTDKWEVSYQVGRKTKTITAKVVIDATELGDVSAMLGVPYTVGMDDQSVDAFAPEDANDIIQDLTYVAILKDYGAGADKTIKKPAGYDPEEFACACVPAGEKGDGVSCDMMLDYGKLPNGKYMINWPNCGNDFYVNLIGLNKKERADRLEEAKDYTRKFIYFIQHELGYKHLGLAEDEFPTKDEFPLIPYHREARRPVAKSLLAVRHLAAPFDQPEKYYRTGVAVGDYPIDHHHDKNEEAPDIDFINIKVPSYNIPLGSLVPESQPNLVFAEKSIGVSNIVNGATRLQPVVMGIGQAAGALAAVAAKQDVNPAEVSIREVQQALLDQGAYLMPYKDVAATHPAFEAIQKIGATGIMKGTGVPYKWANETWFYPSQPISQYQLKEGLLSYYPELKEVHASGAWVDTKFLKEIFSWLGVSMPRDLETIPGISTEASYLSRAEVAVYLQAALDPFAQPVNFDGHLISEK
ncbi:FAD-dependent oxidoreductase [Marinoscillum furvescens]|uniref:FAD dependent oxidoreductase n=1 Tax=Marinoscillum furvescens DSM 4134 TaxID=1122208 RepID=A0A3D9KXE3_MARFU|nr:FAD-dependent oxidoreductase [Marinoscillum furvescens]RED93610.1 FAD dependent oxidoreductase [Marinoscillum furvescens DSM 4134]